MRIRFSTLLLACLLWSCDAEPADSSCCDELEAATPLPGTSVYQLAHEFRDQDGTQVRLADLRGTPVLLAMMFSSCEYACPALLEDMRVIERQLGDQRSRIVLVSFDTERDTPERLKEYALTQKLDPSRWTLLHGGSAAVRELAAILGVRYKAAPKIGFSHSNLIHLLDAQGVLQHQQKGLGASPKRTLEVLRRLKS